MAIALLLILGFGCLFLVNETRYYKRLEFEDHVIRRLNDIENKLVK